MNPGPTWRPQRSSSQRADELTRAVTDFVAVTLTVAFDVDESDATCMATAMIESEGAAETFDALVGSPTEPDTITSSFLLLGVGIFTAAESCGASLDFLGVGGADQYGDDPELDALYDACASGSGAACDQLFFASPIASEYERFGATCGDRFPSILSAPELCEGAI